MTQIPIQLIQREAKTLKFTITDADGVIVDASLATLSFYFKETQNGTAKYTKLDATFNKIDASLGIVKLSLSATELDYTGKYFGLLETKFSATNIDKNYFQIRLTSSPE